MVVSAADLGLIDDRRLPTTTLDGWRRFVDEDPLTVDLLPEADLAGLDAAERADYDETRMKHHSELIVVETSTVREVVHQGRLLMLLNQREVSARRGLIVSGQWATGKSTAIKQLGRAHELLVRRRFPGQDRIPVVYVTAPPKGSPKKLATQFAHFLGMPPFRSRANEMDIATVVCGVLTDARTDLVIVDEIHNVNLATSAGEDLSDHLKYFTEHLPATFVTPASTWSPPGCSPASAGSRSPPGACLPRPASSPTGRSGTAWSRPWSTCCACTVTNPARCSSRPDTCTSGPAGSSAACRTSSGPRRSARSWTAASASPESCWTP